MKYLKLFTLLAASVMTMFSFAATANAKITVTDENAPFKPSIYVVLTQNSSLSVSNTGPYTINNGNDFSLNLYITDGTNQYSGIETSELEGLKVVFKANKVNTVYTMSFSEVDGAEYFLQKGDDTDPENWIPMTADYTIECAVSEEIIFTVVKEAAPEEYIHHRNVAANSFGTICFPYEITAMEGVKDGKLLEFVTNGVTFVEAQEVELADMEVGKAYIFEASADAQSFTYDPESSVAEPIDNNGLVGTFAEEGIDIEADAWIIKGSAIKAVLAGSSVPQYRAYIPSLDDIHTIQASAPVRRFLVGEATGMQEVKAMEGTHKAIVNGRLVIIREGRMFNALGGMK